MDPVINSDELTPAATKTAPARLAPLWHTAILVVALLANSIGSAFSKHPAASSGHLIYQYLFQMSVEWVVFAYVVWGVTRSGTKFRDLVGGRWAEFEDFLLDVAIGIGTWIMCYVAAATVAIAIGLTHHPERVKAAKGAIEFLYPHTVAESLVAVGLAITAGICEETIFRGYLQRQIGSITNNIWIGLVAGALLFGAAHGYQTWWQMVMICMIGIVLGVVAHLRKSLRPGMFAHTLLDTTSLLLGRFVNMK